jgi:hypothetical protein
MVERLLYIYVALSCYPMENSNFTFKFTWNHCLQGCCLQGFFFFWTNLGNGREIVTLTLRHSHRDPLLCSSYGLLGGPGPWDRGIT